MKKMFSLLAIAILSLRLSAAAGAGSQLIGSDEARLSREFHLEGEHSRAIQFFKMESRLVMHGQNGVPLTTDVYRLWLRWVPARLAGTNGDQITCLRFSVQLGAAREAAIPSLKGWSYEFVSREKDEKGQTLGIAHKPFEDLADENGKRLPPENAYHVYNAFIDFHAFFLFTDKTDGGAGIQDLTRLGQRIVHVASNSTPAVNLGSAVAEGSFFKNGEITLELKGLGLARGMACAIVGYDSGESSFTVIMKPAPAIEARTVGSSHYWGDIYKSLETNWIQKATLHEMVVSETTVSAMPKKLNGIIDRSISLLNMQVDDFKASIP